MTVALYPAPGLIQHYLENRMGQSDSFLVQEHFSFQKRSSSKINGWTPLDLIMIRNIHSEQDKLAYSMC